MSAYDDAVAYLDAEVHPRCDYEIYSDMRDIVDEMEAENAKLRELARFIMHQCNDGNPRCDECINWNGGECVVLQRMRELGVTDG